MHTYSVRTKKNFFGALEIQKVSNISEIMKMVKQLKVEAYFAVEISPPIDHVDAIQVTFQGDTKGFFKKVPIPPEYTLDIVIMDEFGKHKLWYMSNAMGYDEMHNILVNFVERQELPDYKSWLDATKIMIKKNM